MQTVVLSVLVFTSVISALETSVTIAAHRTLHVARDTLSGKGVERGSTVSTSRGPLKMIDLCAGHDVAVVEPSTYSGSIVLMECAVDVSSSSSSFRVNTTAVVATVADIIDAAPQGLILTDSVLSRVPSLEEFFISRSLSLPVVTIAGKGESVSALMATAEAQIMGSVTAVIGDPKKDAPTPLQLPEATVIQSTVKHAVASTKKPTSYSRRMLLTSTVDVIGFTPSRAFADLSGPAAAISVFQQVAPAIRSMTSADNSVELQTLLSNHGRMNYIGTRRWLSNQSATLLDSMDLVVSLDTLLSKVDSPLSQLFVHTATTMSPSMESFTSSLRVHAAKRNIEVHVVTRKINASHHDLRFEHEVFAHKKFSALTISTVHDTKDQLLRQSRGSTSGEEAREVQIIASIVTNAVKEFLGVNAKTSEDMGVDGVTSAPVKEMIDLGRSATTSSTLLGATPAMRLAEKQLRLNQKGLLGVHTTVRRFPVSGLPIEVFGPLDVQVTLFLSRDVAFELGITVLIAIYISVFSVVQFGLKKTWKLFTGQPIES